MNNATITLASDGQPTFIDLAALDFNGSYLAGDGEIVFGGTTPNDFHNRIYSFIPADTLFVSPGVTIRTGTSGGEITGSELVPVIEGKIISDVPDRTVTIGDDALIVQGTLTVDAGADIEVVVRGFVRLEDATVNVKIGGPADSDIGRLSFLTYEFLDALELDGTLNVTLVNDFTPAPCTVLNIMSWDDFGSGEFSVFNGPDLGAGGSFDVYYLARYLDLVAPGNGSECDINLSLLADLVITTNEGICFPAVFNPCEDRNAVDRIESAWCTGADDRFIELEFPADVTVRDINIVPGGDSSSSHYLTGRFELFDASDIRLYDSAIVTLTDGAISHDVIPDTMNVRKARFSGVTWGGDASCIDEIEVIGVQP